MKRMLLAAPAALLLAMSARPAAAAETGTGTIRFTGSIDSGTCSIDVVVPGLPAGAPIFLGQASPVDFPAKGTEVNTQAFSLRVDPASGCTIADGVATVTFTSNDGAHPDDTDLHAIRPAGAKGIGIAIRDARTKTIIAHGAQSADFATEVDKPVVLDFTAGLMSALPPARINPGPTYADVNFVVSLP